MKLLDKVFISDIIEEDTDVRPKEANMTRSLFVVIALSVLFTACAGSLPTGPESVLTPVARAANLEETGFDALGYNRTARIFQGPADGLDGGLDGTIYGDSTFARDLLKMKWNAEWDRGNAEGWSDPNGYNAWIDNEWNGRVPGGTGSVWRYMIKWIGACGADGTPTPNGGYCIWGQFEVMMSHGTIADQHFWDAHARPTGFGI